MPSSIQRAVNVRIKVGFKLVSLISILFILGGYRLCASHGQVPAANHSLSFLSIGFQVHAWGARLMHGRHLKNGCVLLFSAGKLISAGSRIRYVQLRRRYESQYVRLMSSQFMYFSLESHCSMSL